MAAYSIRILKEDSLARVEWVESDAGDGPWIRRVAGGGKWPLSRRLARHLMARERRALQRLHGLPGLPCLVESKELLELESPGRGVPDPRELLIREATRGLALHRATELPVNFFERLEELVAAVHARGLCHNDLHKEQNILVDENGFPGLIDFQLASVHHSESRTFRVRRHEDLRHLQKHRRRYLRDGRGPAGIPVDASIQSGAGAGLRRRPLSLAWRRTGKPLYHFITRRILHRWDGEERRESSGPWPKWTPAIEPWPSPPKKRGH